MPRFARGSAALILAITSMATAEDAPQADMTIAPDPELPTVLSDDAEAQTPEVAFYEGFAHTPPLTWYCDWDLSVDSDPTVEASIQGTMDFYNYSDETKSFDVEFRVPLCPTIETESVIGALVYVTLTTDADGGSMTLDDVGEAVWTALADGAPAQTLWYAPFQLSSTGAGTAQTAFSFGEPFPSLPGPPMSNSTGIRVQFDLTPGDVVSMTTFYFVSAEEENLDPCGDLLGDLNGDGFVNVSDLLVLINNWGPCDGDPCFGDIDGNGQVNVDDLILLFANWG